MRKSLVLASGLFVLAPLAQASADSTDIHGFFDESLQNDYITPRGLMVTNKGLTSQTLDGLVFLLPDNIALAGGTWVDADADQHSPTVGAFNEFDWFFGATVGLGNTKLGAQFVQFLSPPGAFSAETNVEFSASYNDTGMLGPLSLQPYAKLFYAITGDSTVITGRHGDTFDVELGGVPTWDLHAENIPLILTAPTWVTVGPQEYFGGGGDIGVFSTGIVAKYHLAQISPAYGSWYLKGGVQFYDFINRELRVAQTLDGTAPATGGGHANAVLASAGFGFSF
jgi:hypothetical protein